MSSGSIARGLVHAWIRVLLKATLTLFFVGFALGWLVILVPAVGILGWYGAAVWCAATLTFVLLMRRELRLRRHDRGMY